MTIYDTIGGGATVRAVVDELYRRALEDPDLKGYFDGLDMNRLNRHQRAFIAAALGRPGSYRGRAMRAAHAGRSITGHAFDRVVAHLVAILRENGAGEDTIARIADSLGPLRSQVVTA
jgi:hemoglobin